MREDLLREGEKEIVENLLEKDIIGIKKDREEGLLESTLDIDDITGRLIVISPNSLSEDYRETKYQIWRADGGFGCKSHTIGGAVFATCIEDGEEARWRINNVIGVVPEPENS